MAKPAKEKEPQEGKDNEETSLAIEEWKELLKGTIQYHATNTINRIMNVRSEILKRVPQKIEEFKAQYREPDGSSNKMKRIFDRMVGAATHRDFQAFAAAAKDLLRHDKSKKEED